MSVSEIFKSQVSDEIEKAFEKIQIIIWQQRLKSPNLQFIDEQVEHWSSLMLYDGETFPGGESISGKALPAPPFTITMPKDPNTPEYVDRISDVFYDLLFRNNLDLAALDKRRVFLRAIDKRCEELVVWLKDLKTFMIEDPRAYEISAKDQDAKESGEHSFEDGVIESIASILGPLEHYFSSETDYDRAFRVLFYYFNGNDIHEDRKIRTRGRVKWKLGFALGEIHRDILDKPTKEYLTFLTIAFKIFENESLESNRLYDTNLYKYCTSKPPK